MSITSEEYMTVQVNARDLADRLADLLKLRSSQRQALYNALVSAASSEYLRAAMEPYVTAAKGWNRGR